MAEAAQAAGSPQIKVIAQRPPYRTGPGRELALDLRLTGRHIAYLMVAEVGDQEPAVGGHRHPVGIVELGVGSQAAITGVSGRPVPATW
jgi:hypothetical protein